MIYAVVPVKTLAVAKSRLEPALSAAERAGLVENLLQGVLRALAESGVIAATAVVSPDPRAGALAVAMGAVGLLDPGGGLNAALEAGRAWAVGQEATALLVLLGDLPLLAGRDIVAMTALLEAAPADDPTVVLAPDRRDGGTNAMLLRPPGALPFAFGFDSYRRHHAAAVAAGVAVRLYRAPGTAFDLDTPSDLADLPIPVALHL